MSELSREEQDILVSLLSRLTGAPAIHRSDRALPRRRRRTGPKFLTEDQLAALFGAAAGSVRDTAILRLAYHRGLRASEIGRLKVEQYDQVSGRLRFDRLKGSMGGDFGLTKHEVEALNAWLSVRGTDPGPLFPGRHPGRGISRQQLDRLMKRYGSAAGIPPDLRHMHTLKHSCGTHLLARGEGLEDVQDHLGHVSIGNTTIYAKLTNPRRRQRESRLADW